MSLVLLYLLTGFIVSSLIYYFQNKFYPDGHWMIFPKEMFFFAVIIWPLKLLVIICVLLSCFLSNLSMKYLKWMLN